MIWNTNPLRRDISTSLNQFFNLFIYPSFVFFFSIEKAPPKQSIHFNETQRTIEISNRKTQHEGINEVQNKREEKQVYLIVLWNTKKLCCGVIGYFLPFFWKLLAFWCPFLSCLSFGCFLPFYYFPLIKNNTINPSIYVNYNQNNLEWKLF